MWTVVDHGGGWKALKGPQCYYLFSPDDPRFVVLEIAAQLGREHRLGRWQVRAVLLPLLAGEKVPASAMRLLKGSAAAYAGRYQRSLEAVMSRVGARYMPGPRGGRWAGYYYLPTDGDAE